MAASLPGYPSGVRTALVSLGHPRLADRSQSASLNAVFEAYVDHDADWEAAGPTRIGLSSHCVRLILELGMSTTDLEILRDRAMIIVARAHGPRASSAQALPLDSFELDENGSGSTCLVSVLKGGTTAAARRLGSRRFAPVSISEYRHSAHQLLKNGSSKSIAAADSSMGQDVRRTKILLLKGF